jgi:hypothetical protein
MNQYLILLEIFPNIKIKKKKSMGGFLISCVFIIDSSPIRSAAIKKHNNIKIKTVVKKILVYFYDHY